MKTLLVLAQHPGLVETIREGLPPEQYRVIHRSSLEDAEPLLANKLIHACLVDMASTDVQSIWFIERLRRRAPQCPILLYVDNKSWEWEEEAYLRGVTHVLSKPLRPRLLSTLLERLWENAARQPTVPALAPPVSLPVVEPVRLSPALSGTISTTPSVSVLRSFSSILTHSLDADAMLKQFLVLLREILSINRAVIFLRQPLASFGGTSGVEENRRLRVACAVGVSTGLLAHFELSLESGIGGQLLRLGRILRRSSEEGRQDPETQKEFELLGGQVAVPILDRETLLGVAVFDGRLTGEPLLNPELELVFHLLEQLGMAVKNIWLHQQLSANHEVMAQILRELSSACVVVSRDLAIVHANKAARRCFGRTERRGGELEFSDLPAQLGTKVYQVLKTGSAISTFRYEPENSPGAVFEVNIVPFQRDAGGSTASALLMVEDLTQSEQLRRLEVEAANLRLIKTMADRLAHEVGNAMVPLSTHQQLLSEKYKDPEFRSSLDAALADGVKRVTRLINQMRFLARDSMISQEAFPLAPLIEEAFQEARRYQPVKTAQLKYEAGSKPIVVTGDRAALKHALSEVLLNALQANPSDPKIGVKLDADTNGNELHALHIEVQDNGAGFTAEAVQKAAAPFFTTRNVGLGLGLTVTRKIIETHHGKLEIVSPKSGQAGFVRISLPIETQRS